MAGKQTAGAQARPISSVLPRGAIPQAIQWSAWWRSEGIEKAENVAQYWLMGIERPSLRGCEVLLATLHFQGDEPNGQYCRTDK
jgi:hypothetical protein